ncbi:MAG: AsmA family protein [Aquisalimonadaceae bacterium]
MAKIFKWLLVGIFGLALLLAALVAAIAILVDPNDYREDISRLVKENTGQELVIEGDIRLRFFPWLGLDLGRTRLENRAGFGDQPFVQIDSAGVAVQLLPLLRSEVVMDVVRLDGLRVHLVINEQGEANWELDLPETEDGIVTEAPRQEPEPESVPPVNIGRLAGVELSNLNVIYEDRQQGSLQEVGPVNVSIGELVFDGDVPVTADWTAALDEQTRLQGRLSSSLRVNQELNRIRFRIEEMNLTTFAEGLPSRGLVSRVSALAEADLSAQTARVSDLQVDTAGLRLNASADVADLDSEPRVQGRFDIPEVSLRTVLQQLGQEVPETADAEVLKVFSAAGAFSVAGETARVADLAVRLDDTRLDGNLSVTDFGNPMIGFRLEADALNADRYLPPDTDTDNGGTEPTPGAEGNDEPAELPMEMLRSLRLDGSILLGEAIVTGLTMRDVNFTVKADNGLIRINPVGARLYGGEYNGDIRVDATGEQARVNVNERVSNVQIQEIVTELLGKDLLTGSGNLTLQAEAEGVEIMDLVRTLAGQADFRFADGAISGINLAQMVRGASARLQGQSVTEDEPRQTDFTEMAGRVVFEGGKLRNDNLNAQSPLFRINGGGEVDMLEQTVDYRLTINLVGTLTGQDGESLDSLQRVPIPLRFRGDLFSPDISIDLAGALTARQQQQLREEEEALRQRAREAEGEARERVEEEREQIEEKVRDRARDELRRLLR